jgi:hypothetical protein
VAFQAYLKGATCYDSSSSPEARTILIDKSKGYFLKISAATALHHEYQLTTYFYDKGMVLKF